MESVSKMRTELLMLTTEDGAELDGAYYVGESDDRPFVERTSVCLIHAKSTNFYSGPGRFVPPLLVAAGYDCVAFNRRGHDVATISAGFDLGGDGWSTPEDNSRDVRTVVERLKDLGYGQIVLAGHSIGGWLAAQHAATDPAVKALILASPAAGWMGLRRRLRPFERKNVLKEAQSLVEQGYPRKAILLPRWPWLISAEAALADVSAGDLPTLAEHLAGYHGPLLGFCGTEGVEDMLLGPARAALAGAPSKVKEFVTLQGCDHFYRGFEHKVSTLIRDWLLANLPSAHSS